MLIHLISFILYHIFYICGSTLPVSCPANTSLSEVGTCLPDPGYELINGEVTLCRPFHACGGQWHPTEDCTGGADTPNWPTPDRTRCTPYYEFRSNRFYQQITESDTDGILCSLAPCPAGHYCQGGIANYCESSAYPANSLQTACAPPGPHQLSEKLLHGSQDVYQVRECAVGHVCHHGWAVKEQPCTNPLYPADPAHAECRHISTFKAGFVIEKVKLAIGETAYQALACPAGHACTDYQATPCPVTAYGCREDVSLADCAGVPQTTGHSVCPLGVQGGVVRVFRTHVIGETFSAKLGKVLKNGVWTEKSDDMMGLRHQVSVSFDGDLTVTGTMVFSPAAAPAVGAATAAGSATLDNDYLATFTLSLASSALTSPSVSPAPYFDWSNPDFCVSQSKLVALRALASGGLVDSDRFIDVNIYQPYNLNFGGDKLVFVHANVKPSSYTLEGGGSAEWGDWAPTATDSMTFINYLESIDEPLLQEDVYARSKVLSPQTVAFNKSMTKILIFEWRTPSDFIFLADLFPYTPPSSSSHTTRAITHEIDRTHALRLQQNTPADGVSFDNGLFVDRAYFITDDIVAFGGARFGFVLARLGKPDVELVPYTVFYQTRATVSDELLFNTDNYTSETRDLLLAYSIRGTDGPNFTLEVVNPFTSQVVCSAFVPSVVTFIDYNTLLLDRGAVFSIPECRLLSQPLPAAPLWLAPASPGPWLAHLPPTPTSPATASGRLVRGAGVGGRDVVVTVGAGDNTAGLWTVCGENEYVRKVLEIGEEWLEHTPFECAPCSELENDVCLKGIRYEKCPYGYQIDLETRLCVLSDGFIVDGGVVRPCPVGHACEQGVARGCREKGEYQDEMGQKECKKCDFEVLTNKSLIPILDYPSNYVESEAVNIGCTECHPGEFYDIQTRSCTKCDVLANEYSLQHVHQCSICNKTLASIRLASPPLGCEYCSSQNQPVYYDEGTCAPCAGLAGGYTFCEKFVDDNDELYKVVSCPESSFTSEDGLSCVFCPSNSYYSGHECLPCTGLAGSPLICTSPPEALFTTVTSCTDKTTVSDVTGFLCTRADYQTLWLAVVPAVAAVVPVALIVTFALMAWVRKPKETVVETKMVYI